MKKLLSLTLSLLLTTTTLLADNAGMQADLQVNTKLQIRRSGWSDYSSYMTRQQYEDIIIQSLQSMLHRKGISVTGPNADYKITVDHMVMNERLVKHSEKDTHNPEIKRWTYLAKVSVNLEGWVTNLRTGESKRWRRTSSAKESLEDTDDDECTPPRKVRMTPAICANIANSVGRRSARRLHRKMHRMG